jgi:hypothetical protein
MVIGATSVSHGPMEDLDVPWHCVDVGRNGGEDESEVSWYDEVEPSEENREMMTKRRFPTSSSAICNLFGAAD